MIRNILATGALLGMTSVILGAFGAHGLEKVASDSLIESFKTGTTYQFYHALFLLILGALTYQQIVAPKVAKRIFWTILTGVLLFSVSIYFLVFAKINSWETLRVMMIPLTPIGGVTIIVGWLMFFMGVLNKNKA